jgi:Pentapeptide repeats (8 copies)
MWQKIRKPLLVAIGVIVASAVGVALIVVLVLGYRLNWDWTGLGSYTPPTNDSNFQRGKTLWDWFQLLIVPGILAIGAFWFSQIQKSNEQQIANDNQHEAALQGYIDKMSELLLAKDLRKAGEHINKVSELLVAKHLRNFGEDEEVRMIARAKTLAVLRRLDAERKETVFWSLYESCLIFNDKPIIDLSGADLHEVNLSGADLSETDLHEVNLSKANLSFAFLINTNLIKANLSNADLMGKYIPSQLLCGQ